MTTERRFEMAEGIVVETLGVDGRVLDQRTEWYDTADTGKVNPEDVILLTLAGDDEPTDEMVGLADRIINDLNLAGFQLHRDGVPGDLEDPDGEDKLRLAATPPTPADFIVGECERCGEDVYESEPYMTHGEDDGWIQHERCYDDD